LLKELTGRRARIALTAALVSLALPAAAQADLVQGAPTNVQAGFFDDHSISTDNHTGWSMGGSEAEPLAVVFGTTLTSTGSDFRVCGYSSGTAGWLRSHLVSTATCPGTAPAGQTGWMRYITANHDQTATRLFNRWHVMDLQRFALVPLPAAAGGPAAGTPTAWDTFWGTCLSNGTTSMECAQSPVATNVPTAIPANVTKTTQEQNPAPDAQRIAIPADARFQFPDGRYQVVAIANPYGNYGASRSVSCTTIQLSGMGAYAPVATLVEANAATCYVPSNPPAALTGPGGRDPMANAAVGADCPLQPTGHCWLTPPATTDEAPLAPHPLARSNVTTANTITPTSVVGVAQAPSTTPAPSSGSNNPPAAASGRRNARRMTATVSRTYTRSALRKQFGRRLSRVSVTCRVRSSTASTCRVSFRKSGARYSGNVWLRYRTVNSRLRWQYRVEVKKRKSGERTRTIKRAYRTGGTF
jgi:hypothetical protein